MTYWALNALFLGGVAVVAIAAAWAARGIRSRPRPGIRWGAVAITGAVVCAMTAVFDNIMIAVGLVGYSPDHISGALVGIAPLEDFAYAIAAVVLLPALWTLLGGGSPNARGRAAEVPGKPKSAPEVGRGIR